METVFLSLSKSDLQDLIAETVNACLRQHSPKDRPLQPPVTGKLSRKQAAALLGISLPTLDEHTKEGRIKASRIGRRVLYKLADIEAAPAPIKTMGGTK